MRDAKERAYRLLQNFEGFPKTENNWFVEHLRDAIASEITQARAEVWEEAAKIAETKNVCGLDVCSTTLAEIFRARSEREKKSPSPKGGK